VANLVHDGLESVLEGPAAEVDDLATRHADVLAIVELVRIFAGRECNMAGGKEEDSNPSVSFKITRGHVTCSASLSFGD
jgi:hypothetical protein